MMFFQHCKFFLQKYYVFFPAFLFDFSIIFLQGFHHKGKFPHMLICVVWPPKKWNSEEHCFFHNSGWITICLMWPWCAGITNLLMPTMWVCLLQSTYWIPLLLGKNLHPLIYMRGINHQYLASIVHLIYHEKINNTQDNRDDFLQIYT